MTGARGHWALRIAIHRLARLFWLLPLAAVSAFALVSMAPIDPVEAYVGGMTSLIGPEQRELIAEQLGLNASYAERFFIWAGNMITGDMGVSTIFRAPVAEVLAERFAASFILLAAAWAFSFIIGVFLGLVAGGWHNRAVDQAIRTLAMILAVSPGFWVAMVFISVFAVGFDWLPACCSGPPGRLSDEVTLLDQLRHMILPVAALSIIGISPLILHTRQRLIDMMESPPAQLLAMHGASRRMIVFGPGLRHAVAPALALHMASLGEIFGGSVLVETVFGWPGLGAATVQSALRADVPLLVGIALFSVALVLVGNLLADLARAWLDPRLRMRTRA